jgi:carboxypeptidase PM20D1
MRKVLALLGLVALVLTGVLVVRTLRFTAPESQVVPAQRLALDERQMAERFAQALRIRTISDNRALEERAPHLTAFHEYLATTFPLAHTALTREPVEEFSLLYTWPGMNPTLPPVVLMGHFDVVPVDEGTDDRWTHPPFAGVVADGFIWGRGAIDDKVNVLGILEAVESLVGSGFVPERTVYLAFGHDEEVGGAGAAAIARLLEARGVNPLYVLDEGGAVSEGLVQGVSGPIALIGIAEKGYLSLELAVESTGGHSSIPPGETAIGILSRAIVRLEGRPFPLGLTDATRHMLLTIGPTLPFVQRLAMANLWLFEPLVVRGFGADMRGAAMLRTTTAPTILRAGTKDNVLPIRATAVVNLRILPGDDVAGVTESVRQTIDDSRVTLRALADAWEPSPISDPKGPAYAEIERTIHQIFAGALVAPYLVGGGTDARYYAGLSSNVFRFTPMRIGRGDLARFHGTDERLSVESYADAVRFYVQLLENTTGIQITAAGSQ